MLDAPRLVYSPDAALTPHDLPAGFAWYEAGAAVDVAGPVVGVIGEMRDFDRLLQEFPTGVSRTIPLIGLTQAVADHTDILLDERHPTFAGALVTLRPACDRMVKLFNRCSGLTDDARILLSYLVIRDHGLIPCDSVASAAVVGYREARRFPDLVASAELLTSVGFLERHFGERLNACPKCRSARLLVREECSACRSPNLHDQVIFHHFSCAHQAAEGQFRQGENLVCPKCAKVLRHFSVDYDQPGSIIVCGGCGHASGEARIGFRCLGCNLRGDTDHLDPIDIPAYSLTATGRSNILDAAWQPEQHRLPSTTDRASRRAAAFLNDTCFPGGKRVVLAIRAVHSGRHPASPSELSQGLVLANRVIAERFSRSETVEGGTGPYIGSFAAGRNAHLILIEAADNVEFGPEVLGAADDCKRLLATSVNIQIDVLGTR